ncbi:MAG: hypothetical protein JW967_02775 [Dehalococcoidales bacterium]|nr:hypothetical protein [Dehalococcoidales bacterium]
MSPILKAFIFVLITFGLTAVVSMVVAALIRLLAIMVQRKGKVQPENPK